MAKFLGLIEEADTAKVGSITFVSELSQEEFNEYIDSESNLTKFEAHMRRFGLVGGNYEAYIASTNDIYNAFVRRDNSYLMQNPPEVELNRHMQNFLSSVTMYLNITERYLRNEYGIDSEFFSGFKRDCSEAYDTHFAYRFLYQLRNYAQHYGIPITHYNFTDHMNIHDPQKLPHQFTAIVDRDFLLSAGFDWKRLKSEIQSQSNAIDIHPHFIMMMSCLMRIYTNTTEREFVNLLKVAMKAQSYLHRIAGRIGSPCIFDIDKRELTDTANQRNLEFRQIPVYLINAVVAQNFDKLPFRYRFRPRTP